MIKAKVRDPKHKIGARDDVREVKYFSHCSASTVNVRDSKQKKIFFIIITVITKVYGDMLMKLGCNIAYVDSVVKLMRYNNQRKVN